jgi:16S rRNA (uracil1498-N3)-methyltransferase
MEVNQAIDLDEDGGHYVRTVLRLKQDDAITVFNGKGGEYAGILGEVSRKRVSIKLKSWSARDVESPLRVILGLGISRGDRMDLSVQKAVELGANVIVPLTAERCVVSFTPEKKRQRWEHWQRIVQHAVEQCGRTTMPEFGEIVPLQDWVIGQTGLKLFLDPQAEKNLTQLAPVEQCVTLLIGPEGGFSEQERQFAQAAGFTSVRLGQRILRTETAGIAALAAVQMLWGDFGRTESEA